MKRTLWMGLLVLTLSTFALAGSSVDFRNSGATLASGNLMKSSGLNSGRGFATAGGLAHGMIPKEATFNGSFSGPTRTVVTLADSTHNYTLTGASSGAWFSGAKTGATAQLSVTTGLQSAKMLSSSNTNCNGMVPEPGTLGLLGTGLVGLAGALRLKSKA